MVSSFSTMAKGLAMASLVSANIAELATRQTGQCSSLHIMAAGGCALPCTQDGLGLLAPTVSAISAAIPGSDLYLVPYDGAAAQAAVSTPLLVQAVEQYVAECPNTPIMLIGYSLGGIVVTNAVCNGIPYEKNIIASITYGEETFSYPQPYDRGTCRASAPLYARTNTAGCQKFAPVMQSYCNAADPKCCTGGTDNAEHFVYADQYTGDVVSFVSAQYQAFLPKTTSSSSVASAAATQVAVESSSSETSSSSTTSFPNAPYYPNATIPMTTAAGVAPGPQQQPTAFTQTTVYTSSGADSTVVITETIVVTRATTIPLYQPTGITTPSIITTGPAAQTFVPLSAVVESAAPPAATAAANTVVAFGPGGVSSAVVIAASSFVTPSPYQSVGPAGPVGTGAPFNGTGGLTPFNPGNGAGSLAIPSMISAVAMLALGMLL